MYLFSTFLLSYLDEAEKIEDAQPDRWWSKRKDGKLEDAQPDPRWRKWKDGKIENAQPYPSWRRIWKSKPIVRRYVRKLIERSAWLNT